MNLSTDCLFEIASAPIVSGTTDAVSSVIDCESCTEAAFIVNLGAVGAGTTVYVEESDIPDLSSGKNTIGTNATIFNVPATANRLVVVDCIQPLKRYLRLTMTRPGAVVVNSIICIKKPKRRPAAQLATQVSLTCRPYEGI